ncbi:hypothetical protein EJ110_NYTH37748 [Nymphaea thermarum]|nr:hypothetical protein EJ110_NYTH37748 [Nymphaea thermarum]
MGRFLPLAVLVMVAVAFVAPAASTAHNCYPYSKYEALGKFAVKRYNEQNHGNLHFVAVDQCWKLDRGTGHYTYHFITIVSGGKKYETEVIEDLSAPGYPPVHNFGYFKPLY